MIDWPLTAKEAHDRRPEIAEYLRKLADEVESGEFKFLDGEKFSINRTFDPPPPNRED